MPQSITGKQALYSLFGTTSRWESLVYLMAWHNPIGWIITIAAVVGECARTYDHVFTSGGVGPTHDDMTIAGVAPAATGTAA